MLTYKSLEIVNEGSKDQSNEKSNDITQKSIENMQKKFRSHKKKRLTRSKLPPKVKKLVANRKYL